MTTSNTNTGSNLNLNQLTDPQIIVGLVTVSAMCAATNKTASAHVLDQATKRLAELMAEVAQLKAEAAKTSASAQPAKADSKEAKVCQINQRGIATILHALDNLLEEGEELEACGHFDGTTPPRLEDLNMLYASIEKFGIGTLAGEVELAEFLNEYRNEQQQEEQETTQPEQSQQPATKPVPTEQGARAAEIIETFTGRKMNKTFVDKTMDGMPEFLRKMATTKPNPVGTLEERMAYICQQLAPIGEEDIDQEVEDMRQFLNEAAVSAAA
jgi:hypothetical protein